MWKKTLRFILYLVILIVAVPMAVVMFFLPISIFTGEKPRVNYFSKQGFKSRAYASFLAISLPVTMIKDLV